MLRFNNFPRKNYLIIGMGKTGISIYQSLLSSGANTYFWDDNSKVSKVLSKKGYKKYSFKSKNKVDFMIPSPGIHTKGKSAHQLIKKLRSRETKILSELDLFQLYLDQNKNRKNINIIGITGTNGKSTTVSLIYHVLKKNKLNPCLAGNIGKPIFNSKNINKGFYILELSSYQLENSKMFSPDISCILNLTPDHIERHKTLINYGKAKINIFKNIKKSQKGFYNSEGILPKLIRSNLSDLELKMIKPISNNVSMPVLYLKKYKDNCFYKDKNFRFVYKILREIGLTKNNIFDSVSSFKGLQFRKQNVYSNSKILIINDSKSTNYESLINALEQYKNIILICGGMIKSNDINVLDNHLKNIKKVLIIGEDSKVLLNYFKNKINSNYARTLENAVTEIQKIIKYEKNFHTILFSPGAASYDQYDNFEDRGRHFDKLINKLKIS